MRVRLYLPCLFVLFIRCGHPEDKGESSGFSGQEKETNYAVIKFNPSHTWMFRNASPATLTAREIAQVELLLEKCVESINAAEKGQNPEQMINYHASSRKRIDLERYKRQFIAVVNGEGNKIVFVNCFCRGGGMDWAHHYFHPPLDGGNCYFQLKVDLQSGKYFEVEVHGEA